MGSFFFIDDHPSRAGRRAGAIGRAAASLPTSGTGASAAAATAPLDTASPEWAPSSSFRKEVKPPSLFARSEPQWRRWLATAWHWLWDAQDLEDHPRVLQGLSQVRTEFLSVVWDLQSYAASNTRESINQARSLRELWHLRADVFSVIAVHRGQAEAYRRLESLNRHFPVRITTAADQATSGTVSHW
ncbi:MAG: hypothetical protein EOP40_07005 [Rubrivivax sp.]|nr:MAG: hypothetical protein EOP40_07005 [Rubrivivax sp.]